jgi:hypothetical protein
MAVVAYNSGSQIILKFEDITTDFPANGRHIADVTSIGINNPAGSGGSVVVAFTYDSPAIIAAGTATWLTHQTIADGSDAHIVMEFAPVGVKITSTGAGTIAWIKS